MNMKSSKRIFLLLLMLFIVLKTTSGIIDLPEMRIVNHSLFMEQILNRTTTVPTWKRSNSIEILRKLIANRQILTRYNRTLFFTNRTERRRTTELSSPLPANSTTLINLPLLSSSANPNPSSNITVLTIIIVCCFSTLLFLICTLFLRRSLSNAYLKLPCIHSLSTSKQSRNSPPLSYSPIDSKHRERIRLCRGRIKTATCSNFYLTRQEEKENQSEGMGSQQSSCISPKLTKISINSSNRQAPLRCSSSRIRRDRFATPEEFTVEQLYDVYMQKHALDDLAFSTEFKTIPDFEELPYLSATRTIVASKNRFANILPLDATRVILNRLNDDPATDYINGNYISGYKCPNKFIATQGPKADTCEDFWRMIWELKLQSIVMLTNTIEGALRMAKCHQYWPDCDQTIIYGAYQITCIDHEHFHDYEKRLFQLSQISNDKEEPSASSSLTTDDVSSCNSINNESDIRLVVQYHYTQWKDMDVPNDSHTLLHLMQEVNEQTQSEQYPIVVHCTAGVGRTGTYIAIDAMIEKIKKEGKVDVYHFVSQMRQERHLMVQTVKQYVFIYRALLEYYLYGNTRIEGSLFHSVYSNLKKDKQSLLLLEYNKLALLPAENLSHHDAHSPDNIHKNRHTQIVPYDHNRVFLSRILGHPYINASFIKGYSAERSFILTQDPLEETVQEFWRMFIEHNSNCIIQLHTILESTPKCAIYYPNEIDRMMKISSTTLLKLLTKETVEDKFIIRQFYLTDTRETLSKIIYQYEYLLPLSTNDEQENGECIPTILNHTIFDFIGHIKNQNRSMTIHCGNGGPTCAIFALIVILLDQLKNEHAVDIFQSVRALQQQRPAMITLFEQYEYLYEMIRKFLEESFDLTRGKSSLSLNDSIYDNDPETIHHTPLNLE